MQTYSNQTFQKAFTLVEVAIVLIIVGLAVGGILSSLSTQVEQQKLNETRNTVNNVKEALLGYAMSNGRFPCPAATPASGVTAVEKFASGGNATNGKCSVFYNGYVPAVTLGLSPTDTSGYVLDGWNNPIHYAISNVTYVDPVTPPVTYFVFTNSSGMQKAGMQTMASQTLLSVCATGTGIAAGLCAGATDTVNNNSVIVVYSTGKNTSTGGTGTDEAANLNSDKAFVSHPPYAAGAANGEFDDIVEWISPNSIFSRLVQANQLP